MMISGSAPIVVPAIITGQGVDNPSKTGSVEIATMRVNISFVRINRSGHSSSFQRAINTIELQAARAGVMTGSTTLQ